MCSGLWQGTIFSKSSGRPGNESEGVSGPPAKESAWRQSHDGCAQRPIPHFSVFALSCARGTAATAAALKSAFAPYRRVFRAAFTSAENVSLWLTFEGGEFFG